MKEKNLMWISIFALWVVVALYIAYNNYQRYEENKGICYVDVSPLIDKIAVGTSVDKSTTPQQTQNLALEYVNRLHAIFSNPERYGCKTIFMKGAILGGGRDITKEVMRDVWPR